jgi:hypothetical protein
MTQLTYSPRQCTPAECGEDPDTSRDQSKVLEDDVSYLHHHRQGHPGVEYACQIQVQVHAGRELVLPTHEALAKYSRCGRRGTLGQAGIGYSVDPRDRTTISQHGLRP